MSQLLQKRHVARPAPQPASLAAEPAPPPRQPLAPSVQREVKAAEPVEKPPVEPERVRGVPAINWEQFMGVKLFAWIGGLALFFGVAFFVKYSFDNNLISPALRMAIGFVTGVGMVCGGVILTRRNYQTLSQTMCATGIAILYAVTFACRSVYHFELFGAVPTFLLMAVITATAFLLAVRLNARVIAILGMVGGFATPILLSTGQDSPLALFGYIAILDAGLILVAMRRRWLFLCGMGAAGTAIMQFGWLQQFFKTGRYFEGSLTLVPLAVLLGFTLLFFGAVWWAKVRESTHTWISGSALGLAAVAMAFTEWFLSFPTIAERAWLIFGFVFCIDLVVAATVLVDRDGAIFQAAFGLVVFSLLGGWTLSSLNNELLNAGLTLYLLFAMLHSAFPMILQRMRNVEMPSWSKQIFPPLALLLVLVPIFRLPEISLLVWPFILLVDLIAIGAAMMMTAILPVLAVLLLTFTATGVLILRVPESLSGLSTSFILLGSFSVFFVVVGVWLARKFKPGTEDEATWSSDFALQLPVASAALPFLLLIMATLRLSFPDPSPVFVMATLLLLLLLGVARLFRMSDLPAIGLLCLTGLEWSWHFRHFRTESATVPLTWYIGFYLLFAIFPFVFRRHFNETVVPFAVAAISSIPQFYLIYRLVDAAFPNDMMGLLPAAFAIPLLLSLFGVLKMIPESGPARMTQVAWFGGVALLYVTLIFPIQFEREWITVGWALEGLALLWLFHHVPHPGLKIAGTGLLTASFVRLALNPAVLTYHPRSSTPILNWYLYTYGIVTACLYGATRLLAPPRQFIGNVNAQPILGGLGTALAFLLLNIEIADYFSPVGSTLTFQFSGSFGRDMSYSITWALFALALLLHGIMKNNLASRLAALGLLSVTVLKLFLHDLAELAQLYRIAAFIAVAVIAMMASFAYQRFFASHANEEHN